MSQPKSRWKHTINNDQDFSDDGEQDGRGIGIISLQSTGSRRLSRHLAKMLANSRKEAIRKQHIEAEQRQRDELREGYARLKDVLPLSNQKSRKVSILEQGMPDAISASAALTCDHPHSHKLYCHPGPVNKALDCCHCAFKFVYIDLGWGRITCHL